MFEENYMYNTIYVALLVPCTARLSSFRLHHLQIILIYCHRCRYADYYFLTFFFPFNNILFYTRYAHKRKRLLTRLLFTQRERGEREEITIRKTRDKSSRIQNKENTLYYTLDYQSRRMHTPYIYIYIYIYTLPPRN